ncbi:pantoate-beta-alanine ligase [Tieghemostelium lacteum]|uniref:Pantoate--beta-alanine ligase n=1 Tax=Tieghemostelium lacteum TaxID=361077 RepID=A0A151ZCI9_TIELA|nr:pantoate-beta-alanine ligase [Tieghemostelium lacteum]|eukprot:KYQ91660.1 pantoate-beta-alanine ligase [Tieghemostelium lacteum]
MSLNICTTIESLRLAIHEKKLNVKGKPYYEVTVGFVPTMGYLHEGHISLIEQAKLSGCDIVVCSIFVNPTQFNANEDLSSYPVNLERDTKYLQDAKTDILFLPNVQEIYPKDFSTYVTVESMAPVLESIARPGHFRGVATVVTKLLLIVKPNIAFFGQKDAMQCICIKRLVEDLNIDCKVKICDTKRENSGLAMSSRNSYLTEQEQKQATLIYQSMLSIQQNLEKYTTRSQLIQSLSTLIESNPLMKIDYISLSSPINGNETTEETPVSKGQVLSLAVFFSGEKRKTRLIDVLIL